jgi:hypothetical protein
VDQNYIQAASRSGITVIDYFHLGVENAMNEFDGDAYSRMCQFGDRVQMWHLRGLAEDLPFLASYDLSDDSQFDKNSEIDGMDFLVWFARRSCEAGKTGFIVTTHDRLDGSVSIYYGDTLRGAVAKALTRKNVVASRDVIKNN